MREIPLGGKGVALVDDSDHARFARWRWWLVNGYAAREDNRGGSRRLLYLHRQILGLEPGDGLLGDHISRDKLDNRRSNLRVVTQAQGKQNVSSHRGSSSRFRGVSWDTAKGRWVAQVWVDGQRHFLGCFDDEQRAAEAAAEFRAEHMPFSEDALLVR